MAPFGIDRSDGREDGEDWTENYEGVHIPANVWFITEWLD
jgi:hypothetical protein